jgi:hypothetical protein
MKNNPTNQSKSPPQKESLSFVTSISAFLAHLRSSGASEDPSIAAALSGLADSMLALEEAAELLLVKVTHLRAESDTDMEAAAEAISEVNALVSRLKAHARQ